MVLNPIDYNLLEAIPDRKDDLLRWAFDGLVIDGSTTSKVKVICNTPRSPFLFRDIWSISLDYFIKKNDIKATVENLGHSVMNMLTSKSFTYKSSLRLYNTTEVKLMMEEIYKLYENYHVIQKMNMLKCERLRPLKYIAKWNIFCEYYGRISNIMCN